MRKKEISIGGRNVNSGLIDAKYVETHANFVSIIETSTTIDETGGETFASYVLTGVKAHRAKSYVLIGGRYELEIVSFVSIGMNSELIVEIGVVKLGISDAT